VIDAVEGGEFVANHVAGPILRHAAADQALEGTSGGPNEIGAGVVVLRSGEALGSLRDQYPHDGFGELILDRGMGRVGEVLFNDMGECIADAVFDLAFWQ